MYETFNANKNEPICIEMAMKDTQTAVSGENEDNEKSKNAIVQQPQQSTLNFQVHRNCPRHASKWRGESGLSTIEA